MMGSANLAHGSGLCLDLQVVLDNPISGRQPVRDPDAPALVGLRFSVSAAQACRSTCRQVRNLCARTREVTVENCEGILIRNILENLEDY